MNQPKIDTYHPGTILPVGSHQVRIIKYITSGGFAQIYTVEISPPDSFCGSSIACLKRVIVPDKPSLNTLRAEVDAMKLLRNNKHVVSYIDSHASKSNFNNGSYEVFLLMEYCERGGLIDFMNTRLQSRLTESEVLSITSQVSQGIAAMHALQPPLLHRDIKIENVLISKSNQYKICDFGSVSGIIRPPHNPQELQYVQQDVLKNTTAQYRSPEMIDFYRGLSIDEKSDIWAIGVFLYKLCYYTTPFEKKGGEAAILNARYEYPNFPIYSDRLKHLIHAMLMENPNQRPNIYQVIEEISKMQNVPCPIVNFYLVTQQQKHKMVQLQPIPVNTLNVSQTHPILQDGKQRILEQHSSSPMINHQLKKNQTFPLSNQNRPTVHSATVTGSEKFHEYVDEQIQTQDEVFPKLKPQNSSTSTSTPISSSDEEEPSDENAIIDSINLPPMRKKIGGRQSITIGTDVPSKEKIKSIVQQARNDQELSKSQNLSKEYLQKKMLDKLNASEKLYTERKNVNIISPKKNKPIPPPKPDHLRPKVPPKPAFLSNKNYKNLNKDNNGLIDDLDITDIKKRFPSIT